MKNSIDNEAPLQITNEWYLKIPITPKNTQSAGNHTSKNIELLMINS